MQQRIIKFRGKRIDKGELVHGDLLHGVNHKKGKMFILPIQGGVMALGHGLDPLDGYEVDPETIGQFTGLKDKHGKDIYESDVVKLSDPYRENYKICEIRFVNGGFVVEASGWFSGGEADMTTVGWAIEEDIEIEVIGNRYENQDLIPSTQNIKQ
jgi:uncharacterized phage protein (TIGR01671 family)